MIQNINDLSLFLNIVKKFSIDEGVEKKHLLCLVQERHPHIQWEIQSEEILNLGISLKLFTISGNNVTLTPNGERVSSLSDQNLDLNKNQITFIVKNCFFNNTNFAQLIDFLNLFKFNKQYGTLVYNTNEYPVPDISTEILTQLQIILNGSAVWKINVNYVEFVGKKAQRALSQDHLVKILEEQKAVGVKGELLTMQYEKQRLKSKKLFKEAEAIKQSSLTNVSLGYDIKSFKGESQFLAHDFFIEVKARKDKIYSFIISSKRDTNC